MSSSNTSTKNSSEESTKAEQQEEMSSTSNQGRKLTPLPITNPNAKPGQNQAAVHKLSTTMEEEDELEVDSNENRSQPVQSNVPKSSISSASSCNSTSTEPAQNSADNGNLHSKFY